MKTEFDKYLDSLDKTATYRIIKRGFGYPNIGSIIEWSDMHDAFVVINKKTNLCAILGGNPEHDQEHYERIGRYLLKEKIKKERFI